MAEAANAQPNMQETASAISLVSPHAGMFDAWYLLYERYATDRGAQPNRRSAGVLWRWLLDGTYRVAGVIAIENRKDVVGFAHYRPYPHTLDGSEACWIDDLYVADAQRETDLTERLVENVCSIARKRGWSDVTWTASEDERARAIYERIATRSQQTMYRIALEP